MLIPKSDFMVYHFGVCNFMYGKHVLIRMAQYFLTNKHALKSCHVQSEMCLPFWHLLQIQVVHIAKYIFFITQSRKESYYLCSYETNIVAPIITWMQKMKDSNVHINILSWPRKLGKCFGLLVHACFVNNHYISEKAMYIDIEAYTVRRLLAQM